MGMMRRIQIGNDLVDIDQALLDIDRVECEESLYKFLQGGWKFIDPSPFADSWAIEAVAEHLEAVVDGEIRRLVINIPPRMGKSSLCSVAFPAWVWTQPKKTPVSGPSTQFLHASYAYPLALRDSVKCRRLINSPWYQERWADRFSLMPDQNTKGRFDNTEQGVRLCTSVDGGNTGEGGSIIVIDDPNNAKEANSRAMIEEAIEWWDGTMSTRLNDPKTGAFVVIQQRLAEDDITGHILSKNIGDWTHLMLPMEFEPDRSFTTSIGWRDPRTEEGELLAPDRFGPDEVKTLSDQLGPWQAAGQLQQRPEPKGGGIIKRDWWMPWDHDVYPPMEFVVASLDPAFTEKTENDPSAMTVWGIFSGDVVAQNLKKIGNIEIESERVYATSPPRAMMMNAWEEFLEFHQLATKVVETCKKMKVDLLLIESKASGLSLYQEIRRLHAHEDFAVQLIDPKGQDKVARLHAVVPMFAKGLIFAPDRSWSDKVITQVAAFPKAKRDDLTDTVSQALRYLRTNGLLRLEDELRAETQESMRHTGKPPEPLYPA